MFIKIIYNHNNTASPSRKKGVRLLHDCMSSHPQFPSVITVTCGQPQSDMLDEKFQK